MPPKSRTKPSSRRTHTYLLSEDGFRITNGYRFFNRPLYGTHAFDADSIHDSVLVVAGDRPEFLTLLLHAQQGARAGTLFIGLIADGCSKWLHDFEQAETTYNPGIMSYRLSDPLAPGAEIRLDAAPLVDAEGYILRIDMRGVPGSSELVWAFGGIAAYGPRGSHGDYATLEKGVWDAQDCAGNCFEVTARTFRASAPQKHPSKAFLGGCSINGDSGSYAVVDGTAISSGPLALLDSSGESHPMLACHSAASAGAGACAGAGALSTAYIVILRETERGPDAQLYLNDPDRTFRECAEHYRGVARRVVVSTPDGYLDKGTEALCLAMDACWHHPTFMHGAWSWHEPYLGWRHWYGADAFGWHDRVRTAIRAHAATQIKEPESLTPVWTRKHGYLDGGDTKGGLPSMLAGEIVHVFYNMVEVYLDHILYHYQWTGDLDLAREVFPVLKDALEWEERQFAREDGGLYENWLNTWASDAHWYNGSGCIQSSAYNWRANLQTAAMATRLGEDPAEFLDRATRIKRAVDTLLWLPEKGLYGEYKDVIGLRRVHESPELPSIYHPIDFYLTDDLQSYQMLRFTEHTLKNERKTPRRGRLVWSSEWEPPLYSSMGLYPQEVLNTLLCYYRIGQTERAYELLTGCVDSWYQGPVPGAIAHNFTPTGEQFGSTDFSDTVSMFCRCIVEGLFGILPEMQDGIVTVMPGFPREWRNAEIETPDISCAYSRVGLKETVCIRTAKPSTKRLKVIARRPSIRRVLVDGVPADFEIVGGVGHSCVVAESAVCERVTFSVEYHRASSSALSFQPVAARGELYVIEAAGDLCIKGIFDPQNVLDSAAVAEKRLAGRVISGFGYHTFFVSVKDHDLDYWMPVDVDVRPAIEVVRARIDDNGAGAGSICRFAMVNNSAASVGGELVVSFGGESVCCAADVGPHSTSLEVSLPTRDLSGLSPGTNPLSANLGRDEAAASVVAWDLFERFPALARALSDRFKTVDLRASFNDKLEEIHQHDFLSPRPATYSIMTTAEGRPMWDGNLWGYGKPPIVDDSELRGKIGPDGVYMTGPGIPFGQVVKGSNVAVVSMWDNFPTSVTVPVGMAGSKLYFLIAGATHPMQSRIANGRIAARYDDGTEAVLDLVNPLNFDDLICEPYHHEGRTEIIGNKTHAIVLDLITAPEKVMREIEITALSNEVLIGLLGVTVLA